VPSESVRQTGGSPNINDLLDGHVVLDLECVDRIYCNAYVPKLQVGGQVDTFLTEHLGNPIPSPVPFKKIGDRFRRAVLDFAQHEGIPVLKLKRSDRSRWDDRKLDHVRPYLERATGPRIMAIVPTQEIQKIFMGYNRSNKRVCNFGFDKADRAVTVYYFYVVDPYFGPASSSCAATSRTRAKCGSTGTSGPSARSTASASPTQSCPRVSGTARSPTSCNGSAAGLVPATSRPSSTAG
jgi:hypothetical protein